MAEPQPPLTAEMLRDFLQRRVGQLERDLDLLRTIRANGAPPGHPFGSLGTGRLDGLIKAHQGALYENLCMAGHFNVHVHHHQPPVPTPPAGYPGPRTEPLS